MSEVSVGFVACLCVNRVRVKGGKGRLVSVIDCGR